MESPRVRAAHENRKRVIETQRRADCELELRCIFALDLIVNRVRIGYWRVMKNCGECGAGVFGIDIDLIGEQSLVRQATAQLEASFNLHAARFEQLRDDLAEQSRL